MHQKAALMPTAWQLGEKQCGRCPLLCLPLGKSALPDIFTCCCIHGCCCCCCCLSAENVAYQPVRLLAFAALARALFCILLTVCCFYIVVVLAFSRQLAIVLAFPLLSKQSLLKMHVPDLLQLKHAVVSVVVVAASAVVAPFKVLAFALAPRYAGVCAASLSLCL